MIPRRLLLASIVVFAFGASVTVTLVAGFLAALAALEPWAGIPGAVALIAAALTVCLVLLTILISPRQPRREAFGDPQSAQEVFSRVWAKVQARPFLSAGLGALALLLTILNPRYLGAILRAYLREDRRVR